MQILIRDIADRYKHGFLSLNEAKFFLAKYEQFPIHLNIIRDTILSFGLFEKSNQPWVEYNEHVDKVFANRETKFDDEIVPFRVFEMTERAKVELTTHGRLTPLTMSILVNFEKPLVDKILKSALSFQKRMNTMTKESWLDTLAPIPPSMSTNHQ